MSFSGLGLNRYPLIGSGFKTLRGTPLSEIYGSTLHPGVAVRRCSSNINGRTHDTTVAENSSHSDLKDLFSELDLLKKLKPHPNVIQLLGCFTKDVIRCKGRQEFSKFVS